ncbi:hypothetical protein [Nocardia pseudovaccinii]|uniref:hypothetical protein n=1 Tax=Nocardia pseudovaccinii TaxID=189540 RepID=UPI0012F4BD57|nr:hypothetical protein [Nocardia pseudovaccinii]
MSDNTFHDNPETPTATASSPPNPGDTATAGQSPPTGSTPPALDTSPAQVEKLALELFYRPERIDGKPSEAGRSSAADDAADALYTRRLREVQNLAAATTLLADAAVPGEHGDGVPAQLDALTMALGQARRDALADGVAEDDVIAAELLGTEGVPWAAQPSHRWLGRIERLGDQAEASARQAFQYHEQGMRLRIHITGQNTKIRGLEHQLSASHTTLRELLGDNAVPDIAAGRTMGDAEVGDENLQHRAADSGRDIGEAVDATSHASDGGQWVPETEASPEDPAARPEWGRDL